MVKQRWLLVLSLFLLAALAAYVIERLSFLSSARKTKGEVIEVTTSNQRCGGGRKKRSYPCTKFYAQIEFSTDKGTIQPLSLSAGSSREYDQPIYLANYKMGQKVPVIYDPKKPAKAYEDSMWGVWGGPIMLFFFQIGAFFSSFLQPKRRNYRGY